LAAALLGTVLTGCSSGGSSTSAQGRTLRSDLIPAAVAAVEASRGGSPQYTEINAFDQGVNLFVAMGDGSELAYVYSNGTLQPPGAPQTASGAPFSTQGAALDAGPRLIADVKSRLPKDTPVSIALVQRPYDGLVWDVGVLGERGGHIDVLYTPTGVFLGPVADQ
jgi:hypothetical protein